MHDHAPPAPDEGGIRFSAQELLHLGGSVLALSLAFSFALSYQGLLYGDVVWGEVLEVLPWSTLIVFTGFVLHELAHKVAAQRKHMWAEFRASTNGLVLAVLVSAATAIVFAAPGAVHILGSASERDNGEISVVGPLTNLAVGYAAVPLTYTASGFSVGQAGNIWEVVVIVNVFLAGFNMIPVLPLDGAKVWRWNKLVYLAVVGLTVLLGALYLA
jgi:Zn-dependent protease